MFTSVNTKHLYRLSPMANAAAITINDGQATPVAVIFNPESVTNDTASFVDRASGVAVGFRRLTIGSKFAKGTSKVNRAKYSVELPVTATVNGVVTVAYTLRANLDVILPDSSTDVERKNLYAFLQNGLNNALIKGAVRDLDPIY